MKTSSVIVILVALVLIYVAYQYFLGSTNVTVKALVPSVSPITPIHTPGSSTVVISPLAVVTQECTKLPQMKVYIDDLAIVTKVHYDDMKKGFAITKGGAVTDPVLLKQIFDSSNYTYNNEIIKYNSIINQYNCQGVDMLHAVQFGAIT